MVLCHWLHCRESVGLARAGCSYTHVSPVLAFVFKGLTVKSAVGKETVLGMLAMEVEIGNVMFQVVVKRNVGHEQVVELVNVIEYDLPEGVIDVVIRVGVVGVQQT